VNLKTNCMSLSSDRPIVPQARFHVYLDHFILRLVYYRLERFDSIAALQNYTRPETGYSTQNDQHPVLEHEEIVLTAGKLADLRDISHLEWLFLCIFQSLHGIIYLTLVVICFVIAAIHI